MKITAPDLTRGFPRSPKEKLGGYFHLARMIDKARAKAAGTHGEYIYPCPLDMDLLEFLEIPAEAFFDAVRSHDDPGMLEYALGQGRARSPEEIEAWNRRFENRKPRNEESQRHFEAIRNRLAPHRTDITTWPDLLDLEEGRDVPARAAG